MVNYLMPRVYFPGLSDKAYEFVLACQICRSLRGEVSKGEEILSSLATEMCAYPWSTVQVDLLHLPPSKGYNYVLLVIDALTKYVDFEVLKTKSMEEVVIALERIFLRHSIPERIRCDSGKEFENFLFHHLMERYGVKVAHGAVYHPQSQGIVERANRTLLSILRALLLGDGKPSEQWADCIAFAVFCVNHRPSSALGFSMSPFEALFGRKADKSVGVVDASAVAKTIDHLQELQVQESIRNHRKRLQIDLQPGSRVLIRSKKRANKLVPKWQSGWIFQKFIGNADFPTTAFVSNIQDPKKTKAVSLVDLISAGFSQEEISMVEEFEGAEFQKQEELFIVPDPDFLPTTVPVAENTRVAEQTHLADYAPVRVSRYPIRGSRGAQAKRFDEEF